jgi:hypothetical protein
MPAFYRGRNIAINYQARAEKLIPHQRTNRPGVHKPPPNVHWHAYWMLSLGTAFVLLATMNAYLVRVRHYSRHIPTGKYGGAGAPSGPAPILFLVGFLFIGIGWNAIRKHKD